MYSAEANWKNIDRFKCNAYLAPWKPQQIQRTQQRCSIEQVLSYKTWVLNIVPAINYAVLPAMTNSPHTTLLRVCISRDDPLSLSPLLKRPTHCLTLLTSTTSLPKNVQQTLNVSGSLFFPIWANSIPPLWSIVTSVSGIILSDCHSAAICHTATKGNNIGEEILLYFLIPPTLASDIMGRCNKIGGITFRATTTYQLYRDPQIYLSSAVAQRCSNNTFYTFEQGISSSYYWRAMICPP